MANFKVNSLERVLQAFLLTSCLLILGLITALVPQHWPGVAFWSLMLSLGVLLSWVTHTVYRKVINSFERALLHAEALKSEDYNQVSKPVFGQGYCIRVSSKTQVAQPGTDGPEITL